MFKHYYLVRYNTASLSVSPKYIIVKAFTRKDAYKRVRKTLSRHFLISDVHRLKRRIGKEFYGK